MQIQMYELFRNGKTTGIIDMYDRQLAFIEHIKSKYAGLGVDYDKVRYTLKLKTY